jgi:DNA replication protein DnaC
MNNCKKCGIEQHPKTLKQPFGLPDKIFYPSELCSACREIDQKIEDEKAEVIRKQKKLDEMFKSSNINPKFKEAHFENFRVNSGNKKAFDICNSFTPESKHGILIFSPITGTGKTHLATSIINRFLGQATTLFISVPELLDTIRLSFNDEKMKSADLLGSAKRTQILVLDDIGTEKPSDWVKDTLFVLINYRYLQMLPTILTTNCPQSELAQRLGDRIASRLVEMCKMVKIDDKDQRLIKN